MKDPWQNSMVLKDGNPWRELTVHEGRNPVGEPSTEQSVPDRLYPVESTHTEAVR